MKETEWLVRALVRLAQRNLSDANNTQEVKDGAWPAGQTWDQLGSTSQHAFMRRAREESGIPHDEYRAHIEKFYAEGGDLDALWDELSSTASKGGVK